MHGGPGFETGAAEPKPKEPETIDSLKLKYLLNILNHAETERSTMGLMAQSRPHRIAGEIDELVQKVQELCLAPFIAGKPKTDRVNPGGLYTAKGETPESFEARVARYGYAEAGRLLGTEDKPEQPNPMLTNMATPDYRLNDISITAGRVIPVLERRWLNSRGESEWRPVTSGPGRERLVEPISPGKLREHVKSMASTFAEKVVEEVFGPRGDKGPNQP